MKTIDNLWDRVKGAHSAASERASKYCAHNPIKETVKFITQDVPMFYSSYVAGLITNLLYFESREVVRN